MAYRKDVYQYGKYIEYEYKCAGKYGAKGEKRAPKKKATSEQMQKQNQWQKEKIILRKLRYNFEAGDLWVTLKFPKGTRMRGKDLCAIWSKFYRKLKYQYDKRKQIFKFFCRLDIGKKGGVHIHFAVNRLEGTPGTAEIITEIWKEFGKRLHYTPMYEEGDFKKLASYIAKPVSEEAIKGQLSLFGEEEEIEAFTRYSCSRNLKMPEGKPHKYKRRTIRKLVEEGPTPTPGYYIDRDSIRHGENPYTHETYYYYTEIKLDEHVEERWEGDDG